MPENWLITYTDLDLLNRHERLFRLHPQVQEVCLMDNEMSDGALFLRIRFLESFDPILHTSPVKWRYEANEDYLEFTKNQAPPISALSPDAIIRLYLNDSPSISNIATSVANPIRQHLDYTSMARRTVLVEGIPEGALPVYDLDPSEESVFNTLDELLKYSPALQMFPEWVQQGAAMRSMIDGSIVTILSVDEDAKQIQWMSVTGAYGTWNGSRNWFYDDWQWEESTTSVWGRLLSDPLGLD